MTDDEHSGGRSNGFTTKEMLVRLETVVDRIEAKLDAKADKHDLNTFEIKQVAVEAAMNLRLVALETKAANVGAVDTYRRWLMASVFALASALSALVFIYFSLHK